MDSAHINPIVIDAEFTKSQTEVAGLKQVFLHLCAAAVKHVLFERLFLVIRVHVDHHGFQVTTTPLHCCVLKQVGFDLIVKLLSAKLQLED